MDTTPHSLSCYGSLDLRRMNQLQIWLIACATIKMNRDQTKIVVPSGGNVADRDITKSAAESNATNLDVHSDAEHVRLAIYAQLAKEGRVDGASVLAARLSLSHNDIEIALQDLHASRDIVLDAEGGIVLAHPFATENFGFSVMGSAVLWWGGCAWDSFAIPHLVADEPSVLVATRCPGCGTPHVWEVDRHHSPRGDQVVHFATPMRHVWDDVVHSCRHQRIFCRNDCVDAALAREGQADVGARFDIATLWRLASHWYEGRLERGYRRREPAEAARYFRGVGLIGEFWGNA